jgi:hypothetical protein
LSLPRTAPSARDAGLDELLRPEFDIVTGATALAVAWSVCWSGRGGRGLVAAWNILAGLAFPSTS